MAEGTVKWFSDKKGLASSSRKTAMTYSYTIPQSTRLDSRHSLKVSE